MNGNQFVGFFDNESQSLDYWNYYKVADYWLEKISLALKEQREEIVEKIKKMVQTNKHPYMFPLTEKRFLQDINKLWEKY